MSDDHALVTAVIAGAGLGVFSVLADGLIPVRAFVTLGNIIAPWVLVAFVVGRRTVSAGRGAAAGTVALVVGVIVYYVVNAARFGVGAEGSADGYLLSAIPLLWLAAAVSVGPAIGLAGAVTRSSGSTRVAVAAFAPSMLLVAEAGFLVLDRRPWLWDLAHETYRLADAAVFVGMLAVAAVLPAWIVGDRRRRRRVYAAVVVGGLAGTAALRGLYRLLVTVA